MKSANPTEALAQAHFTRLNRASRTSAGLDQSILTDATEALACSAPPRPAFLRSPILRLAAVPSVAVVLLLGLLLLPHLGTPAWAIDQTIQALRSVKGMYLAGWCTYPDQPRRPFEMWARPSAKDPAVSGDFKLREGDDHVAVASERENLTWVATTRAPANGGSVVYLTEGLNRRALMQTDQWFEKLKRESKNWNEQLRDDPQTGRRLAVVTCEGPMLNTARFWEFHFDVETKLPIRARVWFTPDHQGDPHFDFEQIAYDPPLPEDVFTVTIPEGVPIVDCRPLRKALKPESGLSVGEVQPQQACRMVVEAYWNAVIRQDWDGARQLRPLADGNAWDTLKARCQELQPVELSQILFTQHLSDPGTFAEVGCRLKLSDGRTARSILNVDIARLTKGTTAVIADSLGPELEIEQ